MIKFYITEHGLIKEIEAPQTGCWISVVEPTEEEIYALIDDYNLDSGFVKSSLDEIQYAESTTKANITIISDALKEISFVGIGILCFFA